MSDAAPVSMSVLAKSSFSKVAVAAAYAELIGAGLAARAANSDGDAFAAAVDGVAMSSPGNALPANLVKAFVAENGVEALRKLVA